MKGFIEVTEHYLRTEVLIPIKNIGFIEKRKDGVAIIKLIGLSGDFSEFRTLKENSIALTHTVVTKESYTEVIKKIEKS